MARRSEKASLWSEGPRLDHCAQTAGSSEGLRSHTQSCICAYPHAYAHAATNSHPFIWRNNVRRRHPVFWRSEVPKRRVWTRVCVKTTESWERCFSHSQRLSQSGAPCLSLLAVATRVRGRTAGSLVGERRGRKGNQATWANTWGSAQTPSHTDVLAAEAARKQASTLFLPLFLSLCLFFVCSLSLSLSALPCFLFALWSPPFCAACPVSASHLDDYSKAKGARGRIEETLNTAKRLMSLLD